MKNKKLNKLFILALPFAVAGGLFVPTISVKKVNADSSAPIEISSLSSITDMEGNYKLTANIDLSAVAFTSIGTSESPFKGTFDGNGFTISGVFGDVGIDGQYQALFGYTKGATIKNVKVSGIKYKLIAAGGFESYICGGIVGYATNGTVISQCSVDGESIYTTQSEKIIEGNPVQVDNPNVKYTVTYGGIAGVLDVSSRVEDCANYGDIKMDADFGNAKTITAGGIVGEVKVGTISNAINYGDINISSTATKNKFNIGGIVGYLSGEISWVYNTSNAGTIIDEDTNDYVGGIVGYIGNVNPAKGHIRSSVYSQNIDAYGYKNSYLSNGTQENDTEHNDFVRKMSSDNLQDGNLYFSGEEGYAYGTTLIKFLWYGEVGWSTTTWVFNATDHRLKLQEFEKFDINLDSVIDTTGLLVKGADDYTTEVAYGNYRTLKVYYDTAKNNNTYYDVEYVTRNEVEYEDAYFYDNTTNIDESLITINKDVILYNLYSESGKLVGYALRVKSTNETAGSYAFSMKAKEFQGIVYVDERIGGGTVKFSGGTSNTRSFSKNQGSVIAEASAGSKYAFKNWVLYYETTVDEATRDGIVQPNYLFVSSKYWKKAGDIKILNSQSDTINAGSKLTLNFGSEMESFVNENHSYLDQNFLLQAIFDEDPYKIKFTREDEIAIQNIYSVEVNGENMSGLTSIAIGKTGEVVIKITVDAEYEINKDVLFNSVQNSKKQPTISASKESSTLNGVNVTIYTYTFQAGKLDTTKGGNDGRTFEFKLALGEVVEEENPYKLWIILGSSIGGVVVVGLIIFIIIKKTMNRKIKSKKLTKVNVKAEKKEKEPSYKDFF